MVAYIISRCTILDCDQQIPRYLAVPGLLWVQLQGSMMGQPQPQGGLGGCGACGMSQPMMGQPQQTLPDSSLAGCQAGFDGGCAGGMMQPAAIGQAAAPDGGLAGSGVPQ